MQCEIVELKFKGSRRDLFANPGQLSFKVGDSVIVQADNGLDFGRINHVSSLLKQRVEEGQKLKKVIRKASSADLEKQQQNEITAEKALKVGKETLKRAHPQDEAGGLRISVRWQENHVSFYRGEPGRFQKAGEGYCPYLSHTDRVPADRRARRGPSSGRLRRLRPEPVLFNVDTGFHASDYPGGEGTESFPESIQVSRRLRPLEVLPHVRTRFLQYGSQRSRNLPNRSQPKKARASFQISIF